MFNINNTSRVRKLERLFRSSRVSGLSSKRSGLQAFTLKIRVQVPLTLFILFFAFCSGMPAISCAQASEISEPLKIVALSNSEKREAGVWPSFANSWCCGLVVQDNALSARGSGVQIPSAPPWEGSSNGKTAVCETAYAGSIPVLSPHSCSLQGMQGMPLAGSSDSQESDGTVIHKNRTRRTVTDRQHEELMH